jgi:3-deoxy-D-manno-octulosonate 8-phosphate phosphatase (KDO 8-P phosphatase)
MSESLLHITARFKGNFVTEPLEIQQKLFAIKAYVFDWDGVFNNGQKDWQGCSPFNEVDAMGTNLLRFNHWLRTGENPVIAVISGERNASAWALGKREHFHSLYSGFKYKLAALQHLCDQHGLAAQEVAFVMDDVLDFSVAAVCGLRVMVSRPANPLLVDFALRHHLVDYLTAHDGQNYAVRESVELLTGISGIYDETLEHRMNFTETYQQYLHQRNIPEPVFYTQKEFKIIEEKL